MKDMKVVTRSVLLLLAIILLPGLVLFCNNESDSHDLGASSTMMPTSTPQPTAIPAAYQVGLRYARANDTLQYNGYTYELCRTGSDSFLYRYTDPNNKEELWHLGEFAYGLFINDALYYFEDHELWKINLDRPIRESLYRVIGALTFFQYDNYIFLAVGESVERFDLLTETVVTVVSSYQLEGQPLLYYDIVFACNNSLWIVIGDEHIGSSFYKAGLDGSNLTYAGFTVNDYESIKSVNEGYSSINYETTEGETKRISLIDGRELSN